MTPTSLHQAQQTHARILADLDDLAAQIDRVRTKWQTEAPQLFVVGGRRAEDQAPSADGLDVTDCTGVLKGNTDIVCERGQGGAAC